MTQKESGARLVSSTICSHLSTFVCTKIVLLLKWCEFDQWELEKYTTITIWSIESFCGRCYCISLLFSHSLFLQQPMQQLTPTPFSSHLYIPKIDMNLCAFLCGCVNVYVNQRARVLRNHLLFGGIVFRWWLQHGLSRSLSQFARKRFSGARFNVIR